MERSQWRKVVVAELKQPLRGAEILEPMLAEVAQRRARKERRRRRRDQQLPTMPRCSDPGGAVHVGADVALGGQQRRARVNSHPHGKRQGLLGFAGSLERSRRRVKRDEERVSLRVNLNPAVLLERLPKNTAMLREHRRVSISAELVQATASSPRRR